MKTSRRFILTVSLIAIVFSSCKKESNPVMPNETITSKILITIDHLLCVIESDGTNLKVLATGTVGSSVNWQAHLSRDGSKVVYAHVDTTFQQIFLIDLVTMETTNLTGDNIFHESPVLSPDSRDVLYLTAHGWLESLYSKNFQTGETTQLTPGLNCRTPSFSADGSRIAFWLNNGGDSVGVAVIDARGNGLTLLGVGNDPQFFPDGRKMLFNNFIPPYAEGMYTMNADGSNRLFLSNIPFQTRGSISPDGSRIVFSNFVNNNFDIFVMKSDGTQLSNLTNTVGAEYEPSFSPDGRRIVYTTSDTTSIDRLVTMNIDGSDKRVLVEHHGWLRNPSYWHY